ncbi:MAG TPA: hypothetical protein VNN22_18505, partial [Verrucomicrobiae bacterium]|nr:hypothetical protein [Verrucomicrobiae bacterium]
MAKEIMKKFTSPEFQNFTGRIGFLTLALLVLLGLMVNTAEAQTSFTSPGTLSGSWGSNGGYDNSGVVLVPGGPSNAGFPPKAPLWYVWTAPVDGEVTLDTIGSEDFFGQQLDTVLGVYIGTDYTKLTQVAANDDLFPINSTDPQINESGSADYVNFFGSPEVPYVQPFYGPSHLRFNAKGGTTYYFAVDTKTVPLFPDSIFLNWAYQPSGVFRFATEDVDPSTGLLLYQTAQTESQLPQGYDNSANSATLSYYTFNAKGTLVTVTRTAGATGRAVVNYMTVAGAALPALPLGDSPAYVTYTNIFYFTNAAGVFYTNITEVVPGDYTPVTNQLVFDDYEMSKTILIPINPGGGYLNNPNITTNLIFSTTSQGLQQAIQQARSKVANTLSNVVFGVQLTSANPDIYESGDVSLPRIDPTFGTALVKILNSRADPYGPDLVDQVVTNIVAGVTNV